LVVDDEPGIRALLEKVLTQIGYIVDTITNPKIVKDKLNAGERYDAILLDYQNAWNERDRTILTYYRKHACAER